MKSIIKYITSFFKGLFSLLTGMKVTLREFFTKKTTEQYPENRATLKMFDRFRGELVMPHDENNHHKCIACGICEMNCPNGTIKITSEFVTDETGKKKKVLIKYRYDLGSCMFCQLCVKMCPQQAIDGTKPEKPVPECGKYFRPDSPAQGVFRQSAGVVSVDYAAV